MDNAYSIFNFFTGIVIYIFIDIVKFISYTNIYFTKTVYHSIIFNKSFNNEKKCFNIKYMSK